MRLAYVEADAIKASLSSDAAAVVDRILQRRHPRGLQPLDRAILHSPSFADGFNALMDAVTNHLTLTTDINEIIMCRVSIRNRAWYGWEHHAPLARASGVSDTGMKTLAEDQIGAGARESGLTDKQWTVARYTDAMTADVEVADELFAALKSQFSDQEVVEITGTVSEAISWSSPIQITKVGLFQVAAYNCLSRLLVALNGKWRLHYELLSG